MAMGQCSKCLENQWSFDVSQLPLIVATFRYCENEVSFVSEKARRRMSRPHKPCDVPLDNYRDNAGEDSNAPWD